MSFRTHHSVSALALFFLAVGLCPARADDAEMVKGKLFLAKKAYDAKVLKFKKVVIDLLDKREDDARKMGNKKQVDQIKTERATFEKTAELPSGIPAEIKQMIVTERTTLNKAYTTAFKTTSY